MKVMTYNIRHGLGNQLFGGSATSGGGLVDLERTAAVIRSQDADVVALQEVDRFWPRSGSIDQPSELARMLGMESRFAANMILPADGSGRPAGEYGFLILSRLPIVSSIHERFPVIEPYEVRGFIEIRIEIGGVGIVAVICTHLEVGNARDPADSVRQRAEQAAIVAQRVSSSGVPTIVMGDFNAQPTDPELAALLGVESGLRDAWAVASDGGTGFTIPAIPIGLPDRRIDYILASTAFFVISASVIVDDLTRQASDHYPVVAVLEI